MKKNLLGAICLLAVVLAGCKTTLQEQNQNTVSVSGNGIVQTQPDMLQLYVSYSHTAPTTKEAKKVLNKAIQQIVEIVKAEGIEDKHIKTASLNYSVATEWRNGRSVRIGQNARQSLAIQITDIINQPERLSTIIDKITAIEKVEINNMAFDIEDKSKLYEQARELAFQKAREKAEQYAKLSGQTLGNAIMITEITNRDAAQARATFGNMKMMALESSVAYDESAVIPSGEQGVSLSMNVTFELK